MVDTHLVFKHSGVYLPNIPGLVQFVHTVMLNKNDLHSYICRCIALAKIPSFNKCVLILFISA